MQSYMYFSEIVWFVIISNWNVEKIFQIHYQCTFIRGNLRSYCQTLLHVHVH